MRSIFPPILRIVTIAACLLLVWLFVGVAAPSYAEEATYTIAYNYDGGSKGSSAPTSATYNSTLKNTQDGTDYGKGVGMGSWTGTNPWVSISHPTKTNYTFLGWKITGMTAGHNHFFGTTGSQATGADGTKCPPYKSTTASQEVPRYTKYSNLRKSTGTVTFTAQWGVCASLNNQSATNAGTANVYYKANANKYYNSADFSLLIIGVSDSGVSQISKITCPTKTGYTFGGYYTGTNGSGTQYISADGTISSSLHSGRTTNNTLYAKWIANTYYVYYQQGTATGGWSTSTYATQSRAYPGATTLRTNSMTKSSTTAATFTTSFNANGGSCSTSSLTSYQYTNYTANGWTTTSGSTSRTYANGASYGSSSTANVTLYPCFSQSTSYSSIPLPTPTRTGYTFKGWAASSSASSGLTGTYTPTSSLTLYATWSANTYSVYYRQGTATGGTYTVDGSSKSYTTSYTQSRTYPSASTLGTNNMTKSTVWGSYYSQTTSLNANGGSCSTTSILTDSQDYTVYTANGWTTTSGSTSRTYANGASYGASSTGEITLYPCFSASSYTSNTTATLPTPTRSGYTFKGWYSSTESNATRIGGGGDTVYYSTMSEYSAIYAQWTGNTYYTYYRQGDATGGTYTVDGTTRTYSASYNQSRTYPSASTIGTNNMTREPERTGTLFSATTYLDANGGSCPEASVSTSQQAVTAYSPNGWEAADGTAYADGASYGGSSMTEVMLSPAFTSASSIEYGTASMPVPMRTGYTFKGWYDGPSPASTKVASGNETVYYNKMSEYPKVYAQWQENEYYVRYNANTGSGSMQVSSYSYEESRSLSANAFSKTGYTFSCWNTMANGSGTRYEDGQAVSKLSSEPGGYVELYAIWAPISYTVVYDGNGSNGGTTVSSTHVYDVDKSLTSNGFTLSGSVTYDGNGGTPARDKDEVSHVFAGWNTKPDGTGTAYSDGQSVSNLSSEQGQTVTLYAQWEYNDVSYPSASKPKFDFVGWNEDPSAVSGAAEGEIDAPVGNKTLYAIFERASYRISYDGNGATNGASVVDTKHAFGHASTLGGDGYARTGYTFAGYTLSPEGSGTIFQPGQQISEDLTDDAHRSITMHAKWTANRYSVRYDGNGATLGSTASSSAVYDEEFALPDGGFSRSYSITYDAAGGTGAKTGDTAVDEFIGWNSQADGRGTSYAAGNMVKNLSSTDGGEAVLYAQWRLAEIMLPEASRVGYLFDGWEPSYQPGTLMSSGSTASPTDDDVYTAQWTAVTYTISYDGNGATSGSATATTHRFDETSKLGGEGYERTGYTFAGYTLTSDGTGTVFWPGQDILNMSSDEGAELELHAQWTAHSYTIRYDGNGSTSGQMPDEPAVYDESVKLSANQFARSYTVSYDAAGGTCRSEDVAESVFTGWKAGAGASGGPYADGATVSNLSSEDGAEPVLEAQWELGTCELPTPSRIGYSFQGWAASGETGLLASGCLYTPVSDVTLTAEWEAHSYTVSYRGNGAEQSDPADTTHVYDVPAPLGGDGLSRTGYTFAGYTRTVDEPLSSDGVVWPGQDISNWTDADNGNVTVFARWTANSYNVVYDYAYGGEMPLGSCNSLGVKFDASASFKWTGTFKYASDGERRLLVGNGGGGTSGLSFEIDVSGHAVIIHNGAIVAMSASSIRAGEPLSYAAQYDVANSKASMSVRSASAVILAEAVIPTAAGTSGNAFSVGAVAGSISYGKASDVTAKLELAATYDTSFTLPTPTRRGYSFAGWSVPGESSTRGGGTLASNLVSDSGATIVLTAQWERNTYHVDYRGNSGSPSSVVRDIPFDTIWATAAGTLVERDHYTLISWNTKADGSGKAYPAASSQPVWHDTEDLVLYAQWRFSTEVSGALDPLNQDDDGDGVGDNMSFSVPTVINFVADSQGKLTGPSAQSAYIENLSGFDIGVTSMLASAGNGWSIVEKASVSDKQNAFSLAIGPTGSKENIYHYLTKTRIASGEPWRMAKEGNGRSSRVELNTSGAINNVSDDAIISGARAGSVTWYVTSVIE